MIIGVVFAVELTLGNQDKDGFGVESQRGENVNQRGQAKCGRLVNE